MSLDSLFDFEAEEQQKEALRHIVGSPAWRGFFIPKLREVQAEAVDLLLNPSEERKHTDPDDYLRAVVKVCERLIRLGPAELLEYDANQLQQEAAEEYQPTG